MGDKNVEKMFKQLSELISSNHSDLLQQVKEGSNNILKLEKRMKTLESKLSKVEELEKKVAELQVQVKEIDTVKDKVEKLEKDLRGNLNDREQYSRAWSIRIFGLQVSAEDEENLGKDRAVMKKAYDKITKPILSAAKEKGEIETIPAYYNVLENGHKLMTRKVGTA